MHPIGRVLWGVGVSPRVLTCGCILKGSTSRSLSKVLRCNVCAAITEGQKTVVGPLSSDMPSKALNRSDEGQKKVSPPNKGWFEECNLIFDE